MQWIEFNSWMVISCLPLSGPSSVPLNPSSRRLDRPWWSQWGDQLLVQKNACASDHVGKSRWNLEASNLPRFLNLNCSRRLMSRWIRPHSFGSSSSDLRWENNRNVIFPRVVSFKRMSNTTLTNFGKGPTIFAGLFHVTQLQLYETRKVFEGLF